MSIPSRGISTEKTVRRLLAGFSLHAGGRQPVVSIFRTDKVVVFDAAADPIKAVLAQRFDANNAHPAKDRPRPIPAVLVICRDAERAFPNLSGHKHDISETVESIAAQILGDGLNDLGRTWPEEANRPVNLHSGSSSTLPGSGLRLVNLAHVQMVYVQVCRKALDRFRQHIKKVPVAESIFRAIRQREKTGAIALMTITCTKAEGFSMRPKVEKNWRIV